MPAGDSFDTLTKELLKLNENLEDLKKNQDILITFYKQAKPSESELKEIELAKKAEIEKNEKDRLELIKVINDTKIEQIDYNSKFDDLNAKLSVLITNSSVSDESIQNENVQYSTNLAILYFLLFMLPFYFTIKWGSSLLDSAIA